MTLETRGGDGQISSVLWKSGENAQGKRDTEMRSQLC